MPKPFHQLSIDEFAALLDQFSFHRRITEVHMHHTWRPQHSDYRGLPTIESMWLFHTKNNGWSDIAQHVSIAPDGTIWTGRDWNRAPASATGFNGNSSAGPFMFETIGNFDTNHDPFIGAQRDAVLNVVARVQLKFGLPPEALRFHNQMSSKTCPGTAVDYHEIVEAVRALHSQLRSGADGSRDIDDAPFSAEYDADRHRISVRVDDVLASFASSRGSSDALDAELGEEEKPGAYAAASRSVQDAPSGPRGARESDLTPELLNSLRPYVVDLKQGQFSSDGLFTTDQGDVDAIFATHLPKALAAAKERGEKLRIMLYAHGGLVSESSGLGIALKHVSWWRQNGVYPIYFVWETGLMQTLGQILATALARIRPFGGRDIFDFTTDPIIESAARTLGGEKVWSAMKRSAELASWNDGGAAYVAHKLAAFCGANHGDVEVHGCGHSAGAVFHAHFIPTALNAGVPSFRTLSFLAPAIRVDTFVSQLAARIGPGNGVEHLGVFTMAKDWEKNDNCDRVYRKSLLYLIYYALEAERKTPILGLEESIRANPTCSALLGLSGPSNAGDVVWSVSKATSGDSASASTSHGGFDDDRLTMNSVVRRVLAAPASQQIVDFPLPADGSRAVRSWIDEIDWPEDLLPFIAAIAHPALPAPGPTTIASNGGTHPPAASPSHGARRALCIGIDAYPVSPLSGCVADAKMWEQTLLAAGFDHPRMLLNAQATRDAIIGELRSLVQASHSGDVLVFQYSGHGTQLPDHDGDETSGKDQALCPVDFPSGHFLIDDDVAEVIHDLPAGVNLTLFMDCCHSGTISRFAIGSTGGNGSAGRDEHARFVVPTSEMIDAHRRFRASSGGRRAARSGGQDSMPNVLFAACQDAEVAWESNGHGEFTLRATRLFADGLDGLTNADFHESVVSAFGQAPKQHPNLDCAPANRDRAFLAPIADAGRGGLSRDDRSSGVGEKSGQVVATALRALAATISSRR